MAEKKAGSKSAEAADKQLAGWIEQIEQMEQIEQISERNENNSRGER